VALLLILGLVGGNFGYFWYLNREYAQALQLGDIKQATILARRGARLDTRGLNGKTLLMLALAEWDERLAQELVSRGAGVDINDNDGNTPLIAAASQHNLSLIQLFLAHGADPNAKTRSTGWTPIFQVVSPDNDFVGGHIAEPEVKVECMKALLRSGADVAVVDREGRTALDLVIQFFGPKQVETLLRQAGAFRKQALQADPNKENQ
jgi:ankyrin repeat protein